MPALSAENVKGPAPVAGVTLTMPPHVVVLSVNWPVELGGVTLTLRVGEPLPATENARLAGEALRPVDTAVGIGAGGGVAVGDGVTAGPGAAVGVGVGAGVEKIAVGEVVGDVVGLIVGEAVGGVIALTVGVELVDPPPPQATSETTAMPAKTKMERNCSLIPIGMRTPMCTLYHTLMIPQAVSVSCRRETFAQ